MTTIRRGSLNEGDTPSGLLPSRPYRGVAVNVAVGLVMVGE